MIGTTLGPYRIDRELGSGGMGKVYAATVVGRCPGVAEGTRVALKVVHPHLLETPGFFKRFLREGEIGKSVRHENVVRTFDCDQLLVDGTHHSFLSMEYVEGQTLRDLLAELDRVPEELCRHIGREVAKGLAAIHAAGVIHRDMKPENVLITAEHVVKVMDLGVARLNDEALRLSQTGAFVGSIHYAAPECFSEGGKHVDGRADLHALGLVLYELASGVSPYYAESIPEILKKVLHEEPRRLGDVNPQLSPFFEEVVHNLLAKKPDDRFADAATLLQVLEEGENSAWWKSRSKAIRAETHRPLRRIRIPRETAVYGREQDLAKLRALYEKAKSGEGQVVVIEGEAGIGKSRVIDELIGRLQRDGEELNFLFGSYPPSGAASAAGAFSTAFREQFGDDGSAAYLVQTPLLVPAFDALLSGDAAPSGCEPLTKDSLQTCFVHATRGLAAERTTILLIDDLHFATEDARSLFTSLAMAVPGHRILLVGTTRPGIDERWLAGLTRLPQTSQIGLHRLGPKDLVQLLHDTLKSEALATSLSAQVALKSDGNPFFIFEIIRGLREGQFITQRDDGTWVSTRVIDDIQIPSSILDLVNARVADLTEEERDLLDVACCWGFEFDPGLVGEVLGVGRIPLLKRFGQIERQHRLVRASGRNYCFDHHQVQEALYGSLHEQMREEYHAALATALETRTKAADQDPATLDGAVCVDLCEHFLKGAQGERALRYLASALTHLEKGYLNDAAIRLTERALAVPGLLAGKERAEILLRRARRLGLLGRGEAERAALEEARTLADALGEPLLRARVLCALGVHLLRASGHAEAETVFLASLALARAAGGRKEEAAATGNLGTVFLVLGSLAEAREYHERALALYRETLDRQGEASATGSLGIVFSSLGSLAEAREHHERALALCREILDRQGEANATGSLGNLSASLGRLAEARECYERSLALSRETGHRQGEAIGLVNLGPAWHALGDRVRARKALDESVALCREIGAPYPEGYGLMGLGRLADEEGDPAEAVRLTEESLALRRRIGHGDGIAESLLALGDLHRRAGHADAARSAFEESLRLSREQGWAAHAAVALVHLACLPGGDARAAEEALAAAGTEAETAELRLLLWQATGERAHLAAAKRKLDKSLAKVPAEHHAAMLANVRVNREIVAAAKEQGL
jgi:serine/threonine protein kinase/tetratricopeptide (TPR) repeat protein